MLTLITRRDDRSAPPAPAESDAGVTVWRDNDGAVCGYGSSDGSDKWIHLPGVGAFRFQPGSAEVVAFPLPSAGTYLVQDAFNRSVLPLALQALGQEVLHASAVLARDRVVALCAVSGTGKSTIACALARRGHPLWADDAVCFDASRVPIRAVSLPFSLRLRPASAAYFATGENGSRIQLPTESSPAELGAVVVLERSELGAEPALSRLTAAEAFTAALTHAYAFDTEEKARNGRMVTSYLELVDRVPVFRLAFSPGLEGLPQILDLLERTLGNTFPSAA